MNMPLSGRRKTDGAPTMLTVDLRKLGWLLVSTIVIPLLVWGAKSYDASKLDTRRFEADSTRRESDREILNRLDRRVGEMYCTGKPPGCR